MYLGLSSGMVKADKTGVRLRVFFRAGLALQATRTL